MSEPRQTPARDLRHRSIIVTIEDGGDGVSFAKRLADMRAAFPAWHIRGVLHDSELSFIPRRPPAPPQEAEGAAIQLDAAPWGMPTGNQTARPNTATDGGGELELPEVDTGSSRSSRSSAGNVIGQPPRTVRRGLRVRLTGPPHQGRTGSVDEVKHTDRFRVRLDGGAGAWWCAREDVATLPRCANEVNTKGAVVVGGTSAALGHEPRAVVPVEEEKAVSPSTIAENHALRSEVAALSAMLRRAVETLFEGGGSDGGGRRALEQACRTIAVGEVQQSLLTRLMRGEKS